jgi:hypothetical protein
MQNQEQAVVFDEERAGTYDERFAKLAPLRDTLHLLTRLILADLPVNARILLYSTILCLSPFPIQIIRLRRAATLLLEYLGLGNF